MCNSPKKKKSSISDYTLTEDSPGTNTETTRNHLHQNVLVTWTHVKTLQTTNFSYTKQYSTNLDLRNTTLGYGFRIQHRNFGTFPVEDLAHDSGRTLVRAEYGYPNQELKKKSNATVLNTVAASVHT
jgi:hypothetical protein